LSEAIAACSPKTKTTECYLLSRSLASLLQNRGSRTVLHDKGQKDHASRLGDAIKYAKLNRHYAQSFSKEKQIESEVMLQMALFNHANFIQDYKAQKSAEEQIYKLYNQKSDTLSESSAFALEDAFLSIVLHEDTSPPEQDIAKSVDILRDKISDKESASGFSKITQLANLSIGLRKLWQENKNTNLLLEGIRTLEKALSYQEIKEHRVEHAKLRRLYAVFLSDYGRELESIPTLENAAKEFKASAELFRKTMSLHDASFVVSDISNVIGRLQSLGNRECWGKAKDSGDEYTEAVEQYFAVSDPILSNPSKNAQETTKLAMMRQNLDVMYSNASLAFDQCFNETLPKSVAQ
jgi:hypothetical protein